jgi:hypothetical protein
LRPYLPGQEDEVVDFDIEDTEIAHGSDEEQAVVPKKKKRNMKHDLTQYSLNGSGFMAKSEFVAYLVRKYKELHPEMTYQQLKEKFNDDLCATGYRFIGFLCTETEYNNWNNLLKEKRYQPYKPLRRMESVDGVVFFVNTQWTQESMKKIVKLAKEEGMEVETKNKL